MKITACEVNHMKQPMGFWMEKPVFHWAVEDARGTRQEAARIVVREENPRTGMVRIAADTGWETQDSLAAPVDLALSPRTRYWWTVSVRTDAGEEAQSAENWFETGKRSEPWEAKWIGCRGFAAEDDAADRNGVNRHPIFEKAFSLSEAADRIRSARLYLCGLGLYEAQIGTERVGREYLTPYCSDYNRWVQVQTFDVTEHVKTQEPLLRVLLGTGWYKGRFGFDQNPKPFYGTEYKLIAELRIRYEDGREDVIGTDESWQVRASKITFSNLYDGEHQDDTLPELPLQQAICTAPPVGKRMDRLSLPVLVQHRVPVRELIHTPAGETVLDLGQNLAGIFCLHLNVPAGTLVHLQFGEVLQNGCFYRDNLRSANAEYRYRSDGKPVDLVPHFTYYGYRYVKVEGVENLKREDFTALVLYSDVAPLGALTTGDEKINRLIANAEWGKRSNFIDVPTDCPQRDERMGWTGDAQVFSPTALYQSNVYAFYTKYLYDMAQEQAERNGAVPDVVPSFGVNSTACGWGDATTILPWNLYLFTGDRTILRQHYPAMRSWVEYVRGLEADGHRWRDQFHYGDWLALDGDGGTDSVMGGTDTGFCALVCFLYSTEILAQTAKLLEKQEEAREARALAHSIREEIRAEYFSSTGRCCIDTQTACLFAIRFGLCADTALIERRLVEKLEANGRKLQTGFLGTPLLCEVLTKIGRADLAYDLLFNEEYPGWLYEVNLGATTVWERWNSMLPDGHVSSTGMNSFNHYAYGSIVRWIYERAAGLRRSPEVPGFRRVIFAPELSEKLGSCEVTYRSAAGTWHAAWKIEGDNRAKVSLHVPFGCTARVRLPHAPEGTAPAEVGPGDYRWSYTGTAPFCRIYSTDLPLKELLAKPETRACILEALPQMADVPKQEEKRSLRSLAEQYSREDMSAVLDALDQRLSALR